MAHTPSWMEQYLSEAFGRWLRDAGRKGGQAAPPVAALSPAQVEKLQRWEAELSAEGAGAIVLVAYVKED